MTSRFMTNALSALVLAGALSAAPPAAPQSTPAATPAATPVAPLAPAPPGMPQPTAQAAAAHRLDAAAPTGEPAAHQLAPAAPASPQPAVQAAAAHQLDAATPSAKTAARQLDAAAPAGPQLAVQAAAAHQLDAATPSAKTAAHQLDAAAPAGPQSTVQTAAAPAASQQATPAPRLPARAALQIAAAPPAQLDPAAPTRVGVSITERRLTLDEAIKMALENNLDIEIERTTRDTAAQNVLAARGFFDPTFRWAPLFVSDNQPVASVLQGAGGKLTTRNFANVLSLRQKLPEWGTTGFLEFNTQRLTTTNPFTSFNPAISSVLAVGVTQPLLRNFRIDRDRAELRIRQKNVEVASIDLETRAIDVVSRTQQAYYDLIAAREAVTVAQDQVGWGREQLAINQRLVNTGTLAPVEISAAEAELERRVDTWYASLAVVTEAENALKSLIAPERKASLWGDQIIPADDRLLEPSAQDLHEAVDRALKARPELRAITVRGGINDVQKELAANQRKPEVNAIAQYSMNGLAGSISSAANPFANLNGAIYDRLNQLSTAQGLAPIAPASFGSVPPALVGGYGTTLSNLFGGNYQSFQAGVSIDFNLRNRAADAQYGQTLINEKRLRLERARAEQIIEAQVRNALQGIETARQRIAAAEASARAAKEKLDSERRLYQTGESTNFLVLTRQNEYADSRRRAVVARLDFNKSVTRLDQALGATLSSHSIKVQ